MELRKINQEQVEELSKALKGLPVITGMLLDELHIETLRDIPDYLFIPMLTRIRSIKFKLEL